MFTQTWSPTRAQDNFNETPTDARGDAEAELPAQLAGAHPDTPVMMYCTGGIRCDIYSTYLRSKARRPCFLTPLEEPYKRTWIGSAGFVAGMDDLRKLWEGLQVRSRSDVVCVRGDRHLHPNLC